MIYTSKKETNEYLFPSIIKELHLRNNTKLKGIIKNKLENY